MITELEAKRRAAQRQIEELTVQQRAVAAAEAELAQLEQQIEQARVAAEREAVMQRLAELASAGARALADVEQAQEAFDRAIAPLLEAYSAARAQQASVRAAFYQTMATLTPGAYRRDQDPAPAQQLLDELEASGANVAGVLAPLDGRVLPLDRPYPGGHQFPGALSTGLREEAVRRLGHPLPVGRAVQIDLSKTAAQLLAGE
jgi:septal ring factor EnvC (AmiA/AmiB activator)